MEELLTQPKVARFFGVSQKTIERMRQAGELEFLKIRSQVRFTKQHIEDAICRGKVAAPSLKTLTEYGISSGRITMLQQRKAAASAVALGREIARQLKG